MISILCPTRRRPAFLTRMAESVRDTTLPGAVEIVLYIDEDDPTRDQYIVASTTSEVTIKFVFGPRIMLTRCWNECLSSASGDLLMQGNDDIIFRTNGWDVLVEQAFESCKDKILLVHGSDEGQHFTKFGAHGIVHRRWIDTVGYFIPPYFSSDYGDAWINELANGIQRRKFVPFIAEHMHFMFGKAPMDQTTRERLVRHKRDNVDDIWRRTSSERNAATKKLAALIGVQYIPPLPLQASLPKPEESPMPPCPDCAHEYTSKCQDGFRCQRCGKQF